jgi:uncharacterized repeat protein (TIGR03837 family)
LWTILNMLPKTPSPILLWDIFCQVIDNFGDIGVCWRLACNLAQRGQQVRLWLDDDSALAWMAPEGASGVEVRRWTQPLDLSGIVPGDVLVEAFGCEIAPEFIATYARHISARGQKCLWINLEYLSAESYAIRCHGLPSPVMSEPGRGLIKHFFYPGFIDGTGGLLREADLLVRQNNFIRSDWLKQQNIEWNGQRLISLFCYEPSGLDTLLKMLANDTQPTCLLVTHGRGSAAVKACVTRQNSHHPLWNKREALSICYLPQLTQTDFDHLLWACDVNFVRGEDSLVRALWAGKPLIWQIYPQVDGAHIPKLDAFLDWFSAHKTLRALHHAWNGVEPTTKSELKMSQFASATWQTCAAQVRSKLLLQDDLATQLLRFVSKTN